MKTPEARKLIGKKVIWDQPNSSLTPTRTGIVEEVRSKNIMIDGDWKWLPDLVNLRLKGIDKKNDK